MLSGKCFANKEVHNHIAKQLSPNTPVPKIAVTLFRDVIDGVNVHIEVENYILNAPDFSTSSKTKALQNNTSGNEDSAVLEGHAHVFINSNKLQRLYGSDMHIPASALKKGVNQIAISLNSHQHENWMVGDHPIVSSVFFNLDTPDLILHQFSSQPLTHEHH
ncbi:hypothetical protein [Colwellia echini]|uniref:hypothetical protein n=1 Tax=Colwellia echini TaxID=1982103 RepID=UPI001FEBBDDB|nr:hypothetical protein [Colwellia echini]